MGKEREQKVRCDHFFEKCVGIVKFDGKVEKRRNGGGGGKGKRRGEMRGERDRRNNGARFNARNRAESIR